MKMVLAIIAEKKKHSRNKKCSHVSFVFNLQIQHQNIIYGFLVVLFIFYNIWSMHVLK